VFKILNDEKKRKVTVNVVFGGFIVIMGMMCVVVALLVYLYEKNESGIGFLIWGGITNVIGLSCMFKKPRPAVQEKKIPQQCPQCSEQIERPTIQENLKKRNEYILSCPHCEKILSLV